jgi:hypothetical protein
MSTYGELPVDLGEFPIHWDESCFYLYLPIKMAGDNPFNQIRIPERLLSFKPLVDVVINRLTWFPTLSVRDRLPKYKFVRERYIYLTVKHMLVNPDFWGNRGGAHTDGFGTDDMNWIWYDENPTEFCGGEFNITPDHNKSLEEFEEQWNYKNQVTYPNKHLLELTPFVVHRVARVTRYMMRTFVKISLSEHQYNLTGNSHNYLFDYKWEMHDRQAVRNMERYKEHQNADFVPAMLQ